MHEISLLTTPTTPNVRLHFYSPTPHATLAGFQCRMTQGFSIMGPAGGLLQR